LACVLGVATLAIGIGVATGAKLKTKSESITLSPGELGTVTAKCKKRTEQLSGGFEFVPSEPAAPFFLTRSWRDAPVLRGGAAIRRRTWISTGVNLSDESASLTSYVYCRNPKNLPPSATRISTAFLAAHEDIVPLTDVTLETDCSGSRGRGGRAVSGGFKVEYDENTEVFVRASHRQGKHEWVVNARNVGTDPAGRVRTEIWCGSTKLKTQTKTEIASGTDADEAVARCKRGQRVVSGGFETKNFPGEGGPFVYASRKQGRRGWLVRVLATEPEEFTSYAYCEKKKPK
jgi:hypothetical protein